MLKKVGYFKQEEGKFKKKNYMISNQWKAIDIQEQKLKEMVD